MKTSLSLVRTRNAMYQQEVQRDALARELAELQRKVEVLTARKRKRDQAAKKASPLQQQMFRIAKKIERAKVGVEELDVAIGRREHELRAAQQRTAAAVEARRKGGADDDADGDNGEEAERASREMERRARPRRRLGDRRAHPAADGAAGALAVADRAADGPRPRRRARRRRRAAVARGGADEPRARREAAARRPALDEPEAAELDAGRVAAVA